MSSDITPTQDDLARDLRADLEVVEKAAPGPWNSALRIDGAPDDAAVFIPARPKWGGPSILVISPYSGLPRFRRNEDARAIGLMREAWPAAVRRALAAEAEVVRLRAALRLAWRIGCEADAKIMTDAPMSASAHLDELRAVARAGLGGYVPAALTGEEREILRAVRAGGVVVTDDDGEAD